MIELSIREIILIVLIILLGLKTCVEDLKKRRIYNKTLILFIIIGLVLNISTSINDFRFNYILNLLFAFGIGFLLWYVNFWNAGDGKLFFTFICLIPTSFVFLGKTNLYSYNVILYTFVPIFVVFLIFMIFQTTLKEFSRGLKNAFQPMVILNISIAFFSFQWVMELLNVHFGIKANLFLSAIVLFFVFDGIQKLLKIKLIHLFYVAGIIRIVMDFNNIFSLNFLTYFVLQLVIFVGFVYFFVYIAYFKFGTHVKIPDLQPGMLLCERIVKKSENYTVAPNINISLFMFLREKIDKKSIIEIKAKGLTKKDIQQIQKWNKAKIIDVGSLLIQKRVPFAPFQLFGVLITLILYMINLI